MVRCWLRVWMSSDPYALAASSASSPSTAPAAAGRTVRVGAAYNVFDAEELLEFSIASIRGVVDHVCVVYQTGQQT